MLSSRGCRLSSHRRSLLLPSSSCALPTPFRPSAPRPLPMRGVRIFASNQAREEHKKQLAEQKKKADALERAVQTINQILSLGDMFGSAGGGSGKGDGEAKGAEKPEKSAQGGGKVVEKKKGAKGAWVKFVGTGEARIAASGPAAAALWRESARGPAPASAPRLPAPSTPSSETDAQDKDTNNTTTTSGNGTGNTTTAASASASASTVVSPPPGRSLARYLALPLEDYSLLDPKWISREPGDIFILTVPLKEMTRLELEPKLWVRVNIEPEMNRVRFAGLKATLGDPNLDDMFTVTFESELRAAGDKGAVKAGERSEYLESSVKVETALRLPPPWSLVPGFMLSAAGGTILSAVVENLLSSFTDLLVRDYKRWALGANRKAEEATGSLLKKSKKAAAGGDGEEDEEDILVAEVRAEVAGESRTVPLGELGAIGGEESLLKDGQVAAKDWGRASEGGAASPGALDSGSGGNQVPAAQWGAGSAASGSGSSQAAAKAQAQAQASQAAVPTVVPRVLPVEDDEDWVRAGRR